MKIPLPEDLPSWNPAEIVRGLFRIPTKWRWNYEPADEAHAEFASKLEGEPSTWTNPETGEVERWIEWDVPLAHEVVASDDQRRERVEPAPPGAMRSFVMLDASTLARFGRVRRCGCGGWFVARQRTTERCADCKAELDRERERDRDRAKKAKKRGRADRLATCALCDRPLEGRQRTWCAEHAAKGRTLSPEVREELIARRRASPAR